MKIRFLLVLVLSSIMLLSSTTMIHADNGVVLGDVDGSEGLTVIDALKVLKVVAKLEEMGTENVVAADVNLDGTINSDDALLIFKKIIGSIWYYPGEKVIASGKIVIAGDSIASEHDEQEGYQRQLVGWGTVIGDLFDENVIVQNEARSGRSSKSYIRESNYNSYIGKLEKGDYYLISFGHNDEKSGDPSRYTSPTGSSDEKESFKWYLKTYYIDPAVEKGAYPVLISSVVRCRFNGNVLEQQSLVAYATAMEELVEEYKELGVEVGYIDLQQMTTDYYNQVGATEAQSLHAYTATDLDSTHYCEKGARIISAMIVEDMIEQGYDISRFVKTTE